MLETSIFSILTLFMFGGSLAMILSKQTLFSAFGFLLAMIALAGIFAMLDAQFLAIAQILVSVGAVIVLSMLTILTVNMQEEHLPKEPHKYRWFIFGIVLVSPITFVIYKTTSSLYDNFSSMQAIDVKRLGADLFTEWVLPFEIVSILLLSAMLGAVVIARKTYRSKDES